MNIAAVIQYPDHGGQKPEILAVKANEILTAVIHGARKEEVIEVQYAAVQALYNSLEFVRDNFEREVGLFCLLPWICAVIGFLLG